MNPGTPTSARVLMPWLCGGLVGLLGWALHWSPLGEGLDRWSYDLPFQFLTNAPDPNVMVIYMDEASHLKLNQRFDQAWDRSRHAELVRKLTMDRAQLIVFDVVFFDSDSRKDPDFADALRGHPRVVLGAVATEKGMVGPNPTLSSAATNVGLISFPREDPAQGARRLWTQLPVGRSNAPTIAWLAASLLPGGPDARNVPADAGLFYYTAPANLTNSRLAGELPSISYYEALEAPAGYFAGKLVFIGARPQAGFIADRRDEFPNVFTWRTQRYSPGVEVHATAFLNLRSGHWIRRMPEAVECAWLAIAGWLAGWGLGRLGLPRPRSPGGRFASRLAKLPQIPLLPVMLTATASAALVIISAFWLVKAGLWYSWLTVAGIQIPLALVVAVLWHAIRAHWDRLLLQESLMRYLPRKRVVQLLHQPQLLAPGASEQSISILFSDIAASSVVAELKSSAELTRLLNRYFETVISAIHEADGTVMRLIGDAVFAVWNAPEPQDDHRRRACRAAMLLQERLAGFSQEVRQQHLIRLETRVGLHTGIAHVGNIGSGTRFDYTAVGDPVNLAARLEGLNKLLDTRILASKAILETADGGIDLLTRPLGHFRLRGFNQPVEVHEIIGLKNLEMETRSWRNAYADAVACFLNKDFMRAVGHLDEVLALRGQDGPARFLKSYIQRLPPPEQLRDWMGIIEVDGK